MAKRFNVDGRELNPGRLSSVSGGTRLGNTLFAPSYTAQLGVLGAALDSQFERHGRSVETSRNERAAARTTASSPKWKIESVDFFDLEKEGGTITSVSANGGSAVRFVRQCHKCSRQDDLPACKPCGGVHFGSFRMYGGMHGMYCKNCSSGVTRWECPDCHHSNAYDHTVKVMYKGGRTKPKLQESFSGGNPASTIWNYLFVIFLFLFLAYLSAPES